MTVKLFDENPYLSEHSSRIVKIGEFHKKPAIITQETMFFPEGGGQVGDIGRIIVDSFTFSVVDTQEKEGEIYHLIALNSAEEIKKYRAIQVNQEVKLILNWEQRFSNMQQHTGEHLLSGIAHRLYGVENVGFELSNEVVRVDFQKALTKEELEELETQVNKAILDNVSTQTRVYQKEEAKSLTYRSKIEIEKDIRIVTISGYDVCACCTPHVKATGEIGMLKITNVESYKGGIRLQILCGFRLLAYLNLLQEQCKKISQSLSVKMDGLEQGVCQLKESHLQVKEEVVYYQRELAREKVKQIPEDTKFYFEVVELFNGVALREYANEILGKITGVICLLKGDEVKGYQYILASNTLSVREIGKQINEFFHGKGGGKDSMVQGTLFGNYTEVKETILSILEHF